MRSRDNHLLIQIVLQGPGIFVVLCLETLHEKIGLAQLTMLSFPKSFITFPCQLPRVSQHRYPTLIRSNTDSGNNDFTSSEPVRPTITPPDAVEIRFKRGSRRRRKQEEEGVGAEKKAEKVAKDWDSMSLSEKAVELYVGEKGMLFWLNKFAYASIFIVIGGWILFRFVGPSLNLYQLDTPPLPPSSMFK